MGMGERSLRGESWERGEKSQDCRQPRKGDRERITSEVEETLKVVWHCRREERFKKRECSARPNAPERWTKMRMDKCLQGLVSLKKSLVKGGEQARLARAKAWMGEIFPCWRRSLGHGPSLEVCCVARIEGKRRGVVSGGELREGNVGLFCN